MPSILSRIAVVLVITTLLFSNQAVATGLPILLSTHPTCAPEAPTDFSSQALSGLVVFSPQLGKQISAYVFRYIAPHRVASALVLGATGRLAAHLKWTTFSGIDSPLDQWIVVGGFVIGLSLAGTLGVQSISWIVRQKDNRNDRRTFGRTSRIAFVGGLLGLAIGLPATFAFLSMSAWLATAITIVLFALPAKSTDAVINTRSHGEHIDAGRRQSLWVGVLGIGSSVLTGFGATLAVVAPAFDQMIEYFRADEDLSDRIRRFDLDPDEDLVSFRGITPASAINAADQSTLERLNTLWTALSTQLRSLPTEATTLEAAKKRSYALALQVRQLEDIYYFNPRLIATARTDPQSRDAEDMFIQEILRLLPSPEPIDVPSFAVRENIVIAKTAALGVLRRSIAIQAPDQRRTSFSENIVTRMRNLRYHQEFVSQSDPSFFPVELKNKEEAVLNQMIQWTVSRTLESLAHPERLRGEGPRTLKNKISEDEMRIAAELQASLASRPYDAAGRFPDRELGIYLMMIRGYPRFERYQRMNMRVVAQHQQNVHRIPLTQIDNLREIRRWPPSLIRAIQSAAKTSGVPPEILASNLFLGEEQDVTYTIGILLQAYGHRRPSMQRMTETMLNALPRWAKNHTITQRYQDFIGGVLARPSANSSMGTFQVRASEMNRDKTGGRAVGRDEGSVSYQLLDVRLNADGWSQMYRRFIQEVESWRKLAIENPLQFEQEMPQTIARFPYQHLQQGLYMRWDAATYSRLPSLADLEKSGSDWLLAGFHPLFHAKTFVEPRYRYFLSMSGLFDSKAGQFEVTNDQDLESVRRLLNDSDPWIRDAARRTLDSVGAGSGALSLHANALLGAAVMGSPKLVGPFSRRDFIRLKYSA